ncbi:MAG TPA: hypothetical protein VGM67_20045 [Gemmatimonadaceae bacterium]|jgi:hypothetical protein
MQLQVGHMVLALSLMGRQQQQGTRAGDVDTVTKRSRADSVAIVRAARNAQSGFESFRRNRLPSTSAGSGGGVCDMRIGRYCYWRGDEDEETPPVESPDIRQRRNELIRVLDGAAQLLPGDAWVAGQRVRYLVEADSIDAALRAANAECRGPASWCNALAGYAAQVGARFATADSSFSRALAAMDSAQRCQWFDISDLLSGALADRFKKLDCAGREHFVRRLFWFGAPLYSVSATDLLTEHFTRLTRATLSEHSASTDGEAWGDDMRELVIRYGWPRWHTRSTPAFGWEDRPSITGHDAGVPYDFLPSTHALDSISQISSADWELTDSRATNGYAPSYARTVHQIPHQIAVFRRGDSALVVAAWNGRADTLLLGRHLTAALALVNDEGSPVVARLADAPLLGRLTAIAPIDSGIASIEIVAPGDLRASRARVGIAGRTANLLSVSDLLLYAPSDSAATSLDAASSTELPSDVLSGSRALGVFWETYGLPPDVGVADFALSVEQIDVDWLHRAAASIHLSDPATELRVRWQETAIQHDGIAPRGVRLDLSRLRAGRYRIALTVTTSNGGTAVATREVQIE